MQLCGLGAEVLPHRIGALAKHRQQYTLIFTLYIDNATYLCPYRQERDRCTSDVNKNHSGLDELNQG